MFNKCKKFHYDPLLNESFQGDEESNLTTIKTDNTKIHWINKIIVCAFLLTLIMYRFFNCLELLNTASVSTIIDNHSKEFLLMENYSQLISYQRKSREAKYYLNTSECVIPYVNPLTPAIKKIFKPFNATGCNSIQSFVKLRFDVNAQQYFLHMDTNVLKQFAALKILKNPVEDIKCCYRQIVRSGSGPKVDNKYKLLPCTNFHQDFLVPPHINSLIVDCSVGKKKRFHQSVFYMVQVKNKRKYLPQNTTSKSLSPALLPLNRRKPSVILIGIDSLSRINIRRSLPQTFNYLEKKNWFELFGYNKVGDNTFPNLMALLTGQDSGTAYKVCKPSTVGALDKCNFIWKQYKKQGYHTAYAEDCESISTFNYIKKGFKEPPTDYYFRPTALALEHSLKPTKRNGLNYCIANRQYAEYIYDVAVQFTLRFHDEPHFGLFWTNSFSHNSFEVLPRMDFKMLQYFKQLESQGTFENSIVMFLSDHGCRWGPLVEQPEGFLEERLPIFFISLPTWFRNKYPSFVKHLTTNRKRLTSPYDIYMTFHHILKLGDPKYKITPATGCTKCQSLFEEIPENRTCQHAGIPQKWCTCRPLQILQHFDTKLTTIARSVITKINHFIEEKNLTTKCSKLTLKRIKMVKTPFKSEDANKLLYVIDFIVNPRVSPLATFSAIVAYERRKGSLNVALSDILRRSQYESTAKCVNEVELKKYCLCKKK